MKTFLSFSLVVLLLTCLSQRAHAQAGDWMIGPKVGLDISTIYGDNTDNLKPRAGFSAGGFVTYSALDWFGVTAEVLYSQKGTKNQNNSDNFVRLDYVEVPILATFFIPNASAFKPKFYVGPDFALGVGGKSQTSSNGVTTSRDIKYGNDATQNDAKTFDFGGVVGGGVNIKIGQPLWLLLDARYTYGFSNLNPTDNVPNGVTYKNHNSNFAIQVGLGFGI